MERTIRVKGTGRISVRPDTAVVTFTIENTEKDYDNAINTAAERFSALQSALCKTGFVREDVRTTSFNVSADYKSYYDRNNNYKSRFAGYKVTQGIKIEFAMDTALLGKVLSAVSSCIAEPRLKVQFTVKDKDALNDELLASASVNARKRAEILASASGVTLGGLLSIDYSWGEINVFSRTDYALDDCAMMKCCGEDAPSMDFEPDDIDLSDTATFIWNIK